MPRGKPSISMRCANCNGAWKVAEMDHNMQAPTVLFQGRCSCGLMTRLCKTRREVLQIVCKRRGVMPEELEPTEIEVVTATGEAGTPPDFMNQGKGEGESPDAGLTTPDQDVGGPF